MPKPVTPTITVSNVRTTLANLASSAYAESAGFPLDAYETDLGAVFSLRTLLSSWQGGDGRLIRVRADQSDTDKGSADILGDGVNGVVSLASRLVNLDATATGRGLTESDALGDLLDAGALNFTGRVSTLYDQSGNGLHVSQATALAMPRISLGTGTLETLNGNVAIFLDGDEYWERASVSVLTAFSADEMDLYAVMEQDAAQSRNCWLHHEVDSSNFTNVLATYDDVIYFDTADSTPGSGRISVAQPTGWDDAQHLLRLVREPLSATIRVDGTNLASSAMTASRSAGSATLYIGNDTSETLPVRGRIQELFWHRQNQGSTVNDAIETEMNTFYSTF